MTPDVLTEAEAKLPAATSIGTATLSVADLERSLAFYDTLLGFDLLERHRAGATLGAGGVPLLHLNLVPGAGRKPPRATGLFHIAFLLPSRRDLAVVVRRLAEVGLRFGASDHIVSEAIYIDDPDGNGLEIYRDRPRDEWRWDAGRIRMATEPLNGPSLFAELEGVPREEAPRMPAGTRIGHMHLQVGDLARAKAFYVDALGFSLTTDSYPGALFVSAGGYHHHLGLNVWASRGGGPRPDGTAGLDLFELVLPAGGEVATVAGRLDRLGIAHVPTEGGFVVRDPWQTAILVRAA